VLELKNPLARLSRTETKGTVFSCLGETLWYLARSNDLKFIKYYIGIYGKFAERDGTVHGAYGPRMFKMRGNVNQIDNVVKLLRKKPSSRQAVVQLFNAEDLLKAYKDIPCTCTMQYFVRKGALDKVVHMRSNDAFLGLLSRGSEDMTPFPIDRSASMFLFCSLRVKPSFRAARGRFETRVPRSSA